MGGTTPEHPVSMAELERLVEEALDDPQGDRPTCSAAPGARRRCARTWRRFGAGGSCRGCCATSPSATSRSTRARDRDAGAAAAGADRRAVDRPPRGRARRRPRRRRGRADDDAQHRLVVRARGGRRGRRRPEVVSALLAAQPRARREPRRPRRARRLRGDRAHRRHLPAGLEAARPAGRLAAAPGRDRDRQLHLRPGLPSRCSRSRPRRIRRRRSASSCSSSPTRS